MPAFLLIQTAFTGDVVLATAVAEKLRSAYPDSRIDIVVRKGNESLLKAHPYFVKIWVWDKQKNKLRNLFSLARRIRKAGYTHVINLHRFASSGILTLLSGAPDTRGFDKNPLSFLFKKRFPHLISAPSDPYPVHETARNQSLIADLTDHVPALPRLYPTSEDQAKARSFVRRPYYVIAPASVWFTKQFPPQKWIELVAALPADKDVFLIGGPADHALAESIAAGSGGRAQNLCGQLSFLASAALMQGAVMNYVNDSAPLHFCSATDAPVTAVFCSTVPAFGFRPLSPQGRVAQVEGLYCKPCGLHGYKACPEGHFRCALDLPIDHLL